MGGTVCDHAGASPRIFEWGGRAGETISCSQQLIWCCIFITPYCYAHCSLHSIATRHLISNYDASNALSQPQRLNNEMLRRLLDTDLAIHTDLAEGSLTVRMLQPALICLYFTLSKHYLSEGRSSIAICHIQVAHPSLRSHHY